MDNIETRVTVLEHILKEALKHQVANLGTDSEFYSCYTYEGGKLPVWVVLAKAALEQKESG